MQRALGRRVPTDTKHIEKYPLTTATIPTTPVPITIGVNWYENFDSPVKKNNRYWIGLGNLGRIRGGHCVCIRPASLTDSWAWYSYYDQGSEGACVGFGASRMMSLLNRKRYNARWLWNQAKTVDEWPYTNPGDDEGTSVRAAMDVLRTVGHIEVWRGEDELVSLWEGIVANRWATNVGQMRDVLKSPSFDTVQAFPILNSWGEGYPRTVWLPYTVMERLLREDGECTIITDR